MGSAFITSADSFFLVGAYGHNQNESIVIIIVNMDVWAYEHTGIWAYGSMHAHMHRHLGVWEYTCACAQVFGQMGVFMCVHTGIWYT